MRPILWLLAAVPLAAQQPLIRALIFSGHNNHEWRETTPMLKKQLEESGRFEVRVVEEPAGATAPTLAPYDVLILDYCGPRWGEATENAVVEFVKSGKGLVVFHAASYPFGIREVLGEHMTRTGRREPPWAEYRKMVGAHWTEDPKTGHGQRHTFTVKYVDRAHPIAQGLPETFKICDELYHHFALEPDINVLATAYDDAKYGGTGKDEPILWTKSYGQGRVFHTALGHDTAAMMEPGFAASLVRGAMWAARGEVLEAVKPAPGPRLLVVTGGHPYETSFYKLFDDFEWSHAVSNVEAFRKDIRETCDVLVLYDMQNDLPEPGRRNLRDFVESGKGLVVLHHALDNYNNWPWWWREVVGGKYQLKPDGNLPGSTYKHDQELIVRPAAKHPILAGIGEFHIQDETYKRLWISPEVKVLLTTDHPDSDGPVAWISPYAKSRVAVIQLGHDHWSHQHPAYRRLVKNAVNWGAGR